MAYVNLNVISTICNDAIKYLHTANNTQNVQSAVSYTTLSAAAIPPNSATFIQVPNFANVTIQQYPFSNVSYSDLSSNPKTTSSVSPITMTFKDEYGHTVTATNLSNTESQIYAIAAGIINKLIQDNMLSGGNSAVFSGTDYTTNPNLSAIAQLSGNSNDVILFTGTNTFAAGQITDNYISNSANISWNKINSPIVTKTSSYTLTTSDYIVLFNGSNLSVTLPNANIKIGLHYYIKNINTSELVIQTTASQTIDGQLTINLLQYLAYEIVSDGSNWWVIGQNLTGGL